MMSMQHYEHLRSAAWQQLGATMDLLGAKATNNGLTHAALEAFPADGTEHGMLLAYGDDPPSHEGPCAPPDVAESGPWTAWHFSHGL